MNDFIDKITDIKKLTELSSFLSFPVAMMVYISEVGVGGLLFHDKGYPLLIAYPWGAFEGLIATAIFMSIVFFINSYSERMNFTAVVGAILVSFGLFAFIPEKDLTIKLIDNSLWQYASLIMGIVFMKDVYDKKDT